MYSKYGYADITVGGKKYHKPIKEIYSDGKNAIHYFDCPKCKAKDGFRRIFFWDGPIKNGDRYVEDEWCCDNCNPGWDSDCYNPLEDEEDYEYWSNEVWERD